VNLERAMKLGDRLDGHIVQGHVDQIGTVYKHKKQMEAGLTRLNMTSLSTI
jgi:riboflavin synthase alpha subunit